VAPHREISAAEQREIQRQLSSHADPLLLLKFYLAELAHHPKLRQFRLAHPAAPSNRHSR
jgi:hypothetical protein